MTDVKLEGDQDQGSKKRISGYGFNDAAIVKLYCRKKKLKNNF